MHLCHYWRPGAGWAGNRGRRCGPLPFAHAAHVVSAAVFYADFLTILFPVLAFWLFLRGQGRKTLRESAVWYLLAGLSAGLGAMLKPTVGIVIVAVIVILLLWRRPGHATVFTVRAVLCVCVFRLALDSAVYPQLDKTTARRVNTPVLHWVMMGMQGRRRLERGGRWLYPKL